MLFKSCQWNIIVKIEEVSKITFLPLIMQMVSAGDSLGKVRHSMDSHWPSCKNFKCWIQIPSLPEICLSQILSFKPSTIEVLGPHQVLVYIFKQIFFPFFLFWKKWPCLLASMSPIPMQRLVIFLVGNEWASFV